MTKLTWPVLQWNIFSQEPRYQYEQKFIVVTRDCFPESVFYFSNSLCKLWTSLLKRIANSQCIAFQSSKNYFWPWKIRFKTFNRSEDLSLYLQQLALRLLVVQTLSVRFEISPKQFQQDHRLLSTPLYKLEYVIYKLFTPV